MINFPCPQCGNWIQRNDSEEGRSVECGSCKQFCNVPSSDRPKAPPQTTKPKPPPPPPMPLPLPPSKPASVKASNQFNFTDASEEEEDRPIRRRRRRQTAFQLTVRIVASTLLGITLILFFLPWLGVYERYQSKGYPLFRQSGLQIAIGNATAHPILEERWEKERAEEAKDPKKKQKAVDDKPKIDTSAPLMLFFPLLIGIAFAGCAMSADLGRVALYVTLLIGGALLLLLIQFVILDPPIMKALMKALTRDDGADTAIQFERTTDLRYAFSFYCSIALLVVSFGLSLAAVIVQQVSRRS